MADNVEIFPAILVHDRESLKKELKLFERFFSSAQLDIMDGKFVKNKTVSASDFRSIRTGLEFEVHLMVFNPLDYSRKFCRLKKVRRIIFHFEACKDDQEVLDVINLCKKRGIEVGLAINPSTTIKKIGHFIPLLDAVLVMGVTPGFSGQRFRPSTLKKFSEIRKVNSNVVLQFDGGVNKNNFNKIVEAGAQRIALRSALLKAPDLEKAVEDFKSLI